MKRSIFKKTLAVMLSLVMILGTLAALPLGVGAEAAAWDGSTKTKPAGKGTEAEPYQIADGENLAWISANAANFKEKVTYLTFTADVNLNNKDFIPIAAAKAVNIAGNGNTISGLKVEGFADAGLFSLLNGGQITDLHFANSKVDAKAAKNSTAGLLAGTVKGTVVVTGCTTDANSTVSGNLAGGLIGLTYKDGPANLSFVECVNRASVEGTIDESGSPYAGGLLARQGSISQVSFMNCINLGAIKAHAVPTKVSTLIGGLLGESRYVDGNTDKTTFENCVNLGSLTVVMDEGDTTPNVVMGGIIGWQRTQTFTMTNCYDYSIRKLGGADGTSNNGVIGSGADTEVDKYITDVYAVNHPESEAPYAYMANPAFLNTEANVKLAKNFDNASNIALSLTAAITVGDNETSSVLNEINKIAMKVLGEAVVEDAEGAGDPVYDYTWYDADGGTEENPYLIGTADAWAGFVSMTNGMDGQAVTSFDGKYVKLTADIDMAGYKLLAANSTKKAMAIHLDGAGHSISNLKQSGKTSAGLFAIVSAGSTISNLTIKDCDLSAKGKAAAFVAESDGSISFLNCKTEGGSVAGEVYVGGFVAYNSFAATEDVHFVSFDACVNEASVTVTSTTYAYIGGFFGYGAGVSNTRVKFEYCVNTAKVDMTSPCGGSSIGGFVGCINYDYELMHNTLLEVYDSYNVGNLFAHMTAASSDDLNLSVYMGGIIGWARFGGEIYMERVFDYSARQGANAGSYTRNGALVGEAADAENYKTFLYCIAMNKAGSASTYEKMFAASRVTTTEDSTSFVIEKLEDTIVDMNGNNTTLEAEMAIVDELMATVDPATGAYEDPHEDREYDMIGGDETPDPTPNPNPNPNPDTNPDADDSKPGNTDTNTGNNDNGTSAPKAEEEEEVKVGCGASVSATLAVLALTTACGMAIVGKKKED